MFVTDDNELSENWRQCFSFHSPEFNYEGYFGFTAGNSVNKVNDIDFKRVAVFDLDKNSIYSMDGGSGINIKKIDFREDAEIERAKQNPNTSNDIFHLKKKVSRYTSVGSSIHIEESDDLEKTMFKMWEIIRLYNVNIGDMIDTLKKHQDDEGLEDDFVLNPENHDKLFADLQYSQNTIEFMGQNLHMMNSSLEFYSPEKIKERAKEPYEAQPASKSAVDEINSIINELTLKIQTIDGRVNSYIQRTSDAFTQVDNKASRYQEQFHSSLNKAMQNPDLYQKQKVEEESHYGIIIF